MMPPTDEEIEEWLGLFEKESGAAGQAAGAEEENWLASAFDEEPEREPYN